MTDRNWDIDMGMFGGIPCNQCNHVSTTFTEFHDHWASHRKPPTGFESLVGKQIAVVLKDGSMVQGELKSVDPDPDKPGSYLMTCGDMRQIKPPTRPTSRLAQTIQDFMDKLDIDTIG